MHPLDVTPGETRLPHVGLAQACRFHGMRLIGYLDTVYDDDRVGRELACGRARLHELL
jgi:hypothetical protein